MSGRFSFPNEKSKLHVSEGSFNGALFPAFNAKDMTKGAATTKI